jgi:ABC-2 type transport system permease protein
MALAFSTIAIGSLTVIALFTGKHTAPASSSIEGALVMIAGAIPFTAIGLCIGAYFSGSAAPAIANLVFLPMTWLSGFFFPLPAFLQKWVQRIVAIDVKMALAVLAAVTIFFGGPARRRLARVGLAASDLSASVKKYLFFQWIYR